MEKRKKKYVVHIKRALGRESLVWDFSMTSLSTKCNKVNKEEEESESDYGIQKMAKWVKEVKKCTDRKTEARTKI